MFNRAKLVVVMAGLVAFAYVTAATAADSDLARIAGKVTEINGNNLTIATNVEGEAKNTVVTCNEATKITRDSEPNVPLKFNALKVGQEVRAYCDKANNVAVHVHIAKAPATKHYWTSGK